MSTGWYFKAAPRIIYKWVPRLKNEKNYPKVPPRDILNAWASGSTWTPNPSRIGIRSPQQASGFVHRRRA